MKKIRFLEIIGAILSIFAGSFLHFLFEISGKLIPVAVIAAVNESTWEHLKIGFWPVLIFAVIEFLIFRKQVKNFFLAKAVALYFVPIFIIVGFYSYQLVIEDSLLADIILFAVSIVLAYLASYQILKIKKEFKLLNIIAIALIVIAIAAFSLLTYFPPQNFLFLDPVGGGYGISK